MIYNIRLGHAHNSSSSHSIIILDDNEKIPYDDGPQDGYHWSNFILSEDSSKMDYLANQVFNWMVDEKISEDSAKMVVGSIFGFDDVRDNSIDHQSQLKFPRNLKGDLDIKFIEALSKYFKNDRVVILGGNDNDDESGKWVPHGTDLDLQLTSSNTISRYDNIYNFWLIFNKNSGSKIRFRLEEKKESPIVKTFFPELVDIKITNYCYYECQYCYQGSSPKGKHGKTEDIFKLLDYLKEMEVPEVVFGGGEPTTHPDFLDIIDKCVDLGITPNFTSKTIPHNKFLEYIGSFAISVSSVSGVITVIRNMQNIKSFKIIPTIQVIVGVMDEYEFKEIIKLASRAFLNVTLLGFKENKRGKKFKKTNFHEYDWVESINSLKTKENININRIGIDTKLAQMSEESLIKNNINEIFYTLEDGKFSMYFDMVELKYGPSSFINEPDYYDFDLSNFDKVIEDFRKW